MCRVIPRAMFAKPRKPEAIASKSTPLNSQFVFYSLIFLESSSTVSGAHGNFVAFFDDQVGRLAAFFFYLSVYHVADQVRFRLSSLRFWSRISPINWTITSSGKCFIPAAKLLPSFRLGFAALPALFSDGNVTVI